MVESSNLKSSKGRSKTENKESPLQSGDKSMKINDTSARQGDVSNTGDDEDNESTRSSTNGTWTSSKKLSADGGDDDDDTNPSDTKAVNRSKLLVYFAIAVAAAAVGATTYILLSGEQTSTFQSEFDSVSREVANQADLKARNLMGQLKVLGTALTSAAVHAVKNGDASRRWPNITLDDFDLRVQVMHKLSEMEFVAFAPLVTAESRTGYEAFSVASQDWIDQDLAYRGWSATTRSISKKIFAFDQSLFPTTGIAGAGHSHDVNGGGHGPDEGHTLSPWDVEQGVASHTVNDQAASDGYPTDGASHSFHSHRTRRRLERSDNWGDYEATPASTSHHEDDGHHGDNDPHGHGENLFAPIWQIAPVPRNRSIVNLDLLSHPDLEHELLDTIDLQVPLLAKRFDVGFILQAAEGAHTHNVRPRATVIQPVLSHFGKQATVAGFVIGAVSWHVFFKDILADNAGPMEVHVETSCGAGFLYHLHGPTANFAGYDFNSSSTSDRMQTRVQFAAFAAAVTVDGGHDHDHSHAEDGTAETSDYDGHCLSFLRLMPTVEMETQYKTSMPMVYAIVVILVFVVTALVFLFYDYLVSLRQRRLNQQMKSRDTVLSSLFPKSVQRRIMSEAEEKAKLESKHQGRKFFAAKRQMRDFLHEDSVPREPSFLTTKPIADLFPEATIMFADIVGFTAWSSMREPAQVFVLLETIYHEFDNIATRRRVFKVETVGDCYVAVAGLPEPRKDHAVVMARFAQDCLAKLMSLIKSLEAKLGPDTTDLGMRIGLHSGPVTAGVLRGERARFQLFGDTVNTTSRIETTGEKNRIHLSEDTATLLSSAGKAHWLTPREGKVAAKGKGDLSTFWLRSDSSTDTASSSPSELSEAEKLLDSSATETCMDDRVGENEPLLTDKHERLISWNTEVLCRLLKEIRARRIASGRKARQGRSRVETLEKTCSQAGHIVLDEVTEIITLPKFETCNVTDPEDIDLPESVVSQLRDYCRAVAAMYRNHPFHNFEHASHVTMSVVKLLSRIIAPDIDETQQVESTLHDHTYGITSDPLTQFAVVLSALIHDAGHPGVGNAQLVKENAPVATVYKNKSIAEQQSVDLAWDLLLDPSFQELREAIYSDTCEFKRFRQLIVNAVMATDIMDKDLGALRKARWQRAFTQVVKEDQSTSINRKATIVIEHLIQASDVAHTMQHWLVYRKWNERFFRECYTAYLQGRADTNPADTWFEGELNFFNFYVIPLAKNLKDCGVFGVSSDEYLNYAEKNRSEWNLVGRGIVEEMVERVRAEP